MSAYTNYLTGFTNYARWRFNDVSIADGATCTDDEGNVSAIYAHNAGSIARASGPIVGDPRAATLSSGAYIIDSGTPHANAASADDRTILMWVRLTDSAGFDYLYHSYTDSSNYITMFRSGTTIECRSKVGGSLRSVQATSGFTYGEWFMLGVHIGGSGDRKMTINGVDVTVASSNALDSGTAGVVIGARSDGALPLNGEIADVVITDNLSVAEALAAYRAAMISTDPGVPTFPSSVNERRIAWTPSEMDTTHQQGVITDTDRIWISNTDAPGSECGVQMLSRHAPYTELAVNNTILADIDTVAGSAQGYTHIGSGVRVGEYLYYPVSDRSGTYPSATITQWGIVKLSVIDLSVISIQSVTLTDDGTDPDLAGLAYDPDADEFYACTYDTANDLYRIAGEVHATDDYGDVLNKYTTTASVLQAQGLCLARNGNGVKRLYWALVGVSADQPVTELDGTADGTWMLGSDSYIDQNMGSIHVAPEGVWYTRSVSSGLGILGPAYLPYKPSGGDAPDLTHASLSDVVAWWPMRERNGTDVAEVINDITSTIQDQSAGDGAWAAGGVPRLQFNGSSGDAYVSGDGGTALSADTGGSLADGFAVEAVLMLTANGSQHKGVLVLMDSLTSPTARVSIVAAQHTDNDELAVWSNTEGWDSSGYVLPLDQVVHLVIATDEDNVSFYVNGFLVGTAARGATPAADGKFNIGRTNLNGTEQFEGDLWSLRIHTNPDPAPAQVEEWAAAPFAAITPAKRARAVYGPTHYKGRAHHWIKY